MIIQLFFSYRIFNDCLYPRLQSRGELQYIGDRVSDVFYDLSGGRLTYKWYTPAVICLVLAHPTASIC